MQNQLDDLAKQVEREAAEIAAAQPVSSSGLTGRCHFCGAVTRNLQFVERVGDPPNVIERYRGEDCCGH